MKAVKISVLLLLVSALAVYAATTWSFDKSHSKIQFKATHMKISEVTGEFKNYEGEIRTEGDDFTNAKIRMSIDVKSIDTDNKKRDKHLRSEDFLYAEKYPEITFESSKLKKVEDDRYKLSGKMTIRGHTQKETFTAIHNGTIQDPYGKTRSGWKIEGTINRFDYGIQWDKTLDSGGLVVSEEIDINCDVELVKQ